MTTNPILEQIVNIMSTATAKRIQCLQVMRTHRTDSVEYTRLHRATQTLDVAIADLQTIVLSFPEMQSGKKQHVTEAVWETQDG